MHTYTNALATTNGMKNKNGVEWATFHVPLSQYNFVARSKRMTSCHILFTQQIRMNDTQTLNNGKQRENIYTDSGESTMWRKSKWHFGNENCESSTQSVHECEGERGAQRTSQVQFRMRFFFLYTNKYYANIRLMIRFVRYLWCQITTQKRGQQIHSNRTHMGYTQFLDFISDTKLNIQQFKIIRLWNPKCRPTTSNYWAFWKSLAI